MMSRDILPFMSQHIVQCWSMTNKRNEAAVLAVVEGGLPLQEAAHRFGLSSRWLRTLVHRYQLEGLAGLAPRSRKPKSSPTRIPETMRQRVIMTHDNLVLTGMDAGPQSVLDRLQNDPGPIPSRVTIWRILKDNGRVKNQPQKRPRSSWHRFQASLPNEMWQSDFTHVRLASGKDTEVITWLDDHSRFITHISAHHRVTGQIVVDTFTQATHEHGYPQSTLTDNGTVYTARFAAGSKGDSNQKNMFEKLLADLGITQKNGAPGHPTTQGKIERFHQTLKRWLAARDPAENLPDLNALLQTFQTAYNQTRPHRALSGHTTPANAYQALPKAEPTQQIQNKTWRVRHDKVIDGRVTLRYAGKLRHLGIGKTHNHKKVLILVGGPDTMIIDRDTGEILAQHHINADKDYQPKMNDDLRQQGSMS